MRKLGLLGVGLILVSLQAGIVRAEGEPGRFIGAVGLGLPAKGDGFGAIYSGTSATLDGYIGFNVNKNLSLLLAIDSSVFETADPDVYSGEVNFAPSVKYLFGNSGTRFYLIGGLGLNDNIAIAKTPYGTVTASQSSFMIEPGAGVEFFLNDAIDLYLQAKFVDVFAASNFSYFPITVGLNFK